VQRKNEKIKMKNEGAACGGVFENDGDGRVFLGNRALRGVFLLGGKNWTGSTKKRIDN
jgi:hypothetical protein